MSWIYILEHSSKSTVKVGETKVSPDQRKKDYCKTYKLKGFEVAQTFIVPDKYRGAIERAVHKGLKKYRLTGIEKAKEIFSCTVKTAADTIESAIINFEAQAESAAIIVPRAPVKGADAPKTAPKQQTNKQFFKDNWVLFKGNDTDLYKETEACQVIETQGCVTSLRYTDELTNKTYVSYVSTLDLINPEKYDMHSNKDDLDQSVYQRELSNWKADKAYGPKPCPPKCGCKPERCFRIP